MYRVLICDDSAQQLEEVSALASSIMGELEIPGRPECFSAPPPLFDILRQAEDDHFLVLMDVLLGEQNGVDVTARLHEHNRALSVVLMSTSADYILNGYDVRAIQYLLKPLDREKLKRAILRDYEQTYQASLLRVLQRNILYSVKIRDILYLECVNRITEIHTKQEVLSTTEAYNSVVDRLPAGQFGQCRRGICVNFQYISKISIGEAALTGGTVLPIGRTYYEQFRDSFLKFIQNSLK